MEEMESSSKPNAAGRHNGSFERALKEVIREEHEDGKDSARWKSVKDAIRISQVGNAWAGGSAEGSKSPLRSSLGGALTRTISVRVSPRAQQAWGDERDEAVAALLQQRTLAKDPPGKTTSLMALLASDGDGYSDVGDEDSEDGSGVGQGGAEEKEEKEGDMLHTCGVCMVRHRCFAFDTCGHTYCRLCSRELHVSRGNCPLCIDFIHEILCIY